MRTRNDGVVLTITPEMTWVGEEGYYVGTVEYWEPMKRKPLQALVIWDKHGSAVFSTGQTSANDVTEFDAFSDERYAEVQEEYNAWLKKANEEQDNAI